MVESKHVLVSGTVHKLKQAIFGNGLRGTPDAMLSEGTEFRAFPFEEAADMIAVVIAGGLRGEFYEICLHPHEMRPSYPSYKVVAEALERSV
jgi:hypothetical protein